MIGEDVHLENAWRGLEASCVKPGQRYRHYKGRFYRVVRLTLLEKNLRVMVVYEEDLPDNRRPKCFVRPLVEWEERVPWVDVDGGIPRYFRVRDE